MAKKPEEINYSNYDQVDLNEREPTFLRVTQDADGKETRELWFQLKEDIRVAGMAGGGQNNRDSKVVKYAKMGFGAVAAVALMLVAAAAFTFIQDVRSGKSIEEAVDDSSKTLLEDGAKEGASEVIENIINRSTSISKSATTQVAQNSSNQDQGRSSDNGESSATEGYQSSEFEPLIGSYKMPAPTTRVAQSSPPERTIPDNRQAQEAYDSQGPRSYGGISNDDVVQQDYQTGVNRAVVNEDQEIASRAAEQLSEQLFQTDLNNDLDMGTIALNPISASPFMPF